MNNQRSSAASNESSFGLSSDWVYLIIHCWALPLELLLHYNFGRRYLNGTVIAAALWPVVYSHLVGPGPSAEWSVGAFWLVLTLGACHKAKSVKLEKQGRQGHSRYTGLPWLGRLVRVEEGTWKRIVEPLLILGAGWALIDVSHSLGLYILIGGAALSAKCQLQAYHEQEAVTDLNDAYHEQRFVAERFRERKNHD
jgi:hypothetical protein